MRFSVCSPSFLDLRDAILLADYYTNSSAHECLIWDAFSGRGMGFSASTTGYFDDSPVESFDIPSWCTSAGEIAFSQPYYGCDDKARIVLIDPTTSTMPSVSVVSS